MSKIRFLRPRVSFNYWLAVVWRNYVSASFDLVHRVSASGADKSWEPVVQVKHKSSENWLIEDRGCVSQPGSCSTKVSPNLTRMNTRVHSANIFSILKCEMQKGRNKLDCCHRQK